MEPVCRSIGFIITPEELEILTCQVELLVSEVDSFIRTQVAQVILFKC